MDDISTIKRKQKPIPFQIFSDLFLYPPPSFFVTPHFHCATMWSNVLRRIRVDFESLNSPFSFLPFRNCIIDSTFFVVVVAVILKFASYHFLLGCNCVRFNAKRITHAFFYCGCSFRDPDFSVSRRKVIPPLKEMDGISMYALFPYIVW